MTQTSARSDDEVEQRILDLRTEMRRNDLKDPDIMGPLIRFFEDIPLESLPRKHHWLISGVILNDDEYISEPEELDKVLLERAHFVIDKGYGFSIENSLYHLIYVEVDNISEEKRNHGTDYEMFGWGEPYKERLTSIKFYLEHGANPNKTPNSYQTPLDHAQGQDLIEAVQLLRKYGAKTLQELKAEKA